MNRVFLGRPLHWLLLAANIAILCALGLLRLHTRDFNLFVLVLLVAVAATVLVVVFRHRKGERITREPFEES